MAIEKCRVTTLGETTIKRRLKSLGRYLCDNLPSAFTLEDLYADECGTIFLKVLYLTNLSSVSFYFTPEDDIGDYNVVTEAKRAAVAVPVKFLRDEAVEELKNERRIIVVPGVR